MKGIFGLLAQRFRWWTSVARIISMRLVVLLVPVGKCYSAGLSSKRKIRNRIVNGMWLYSC